MRRLAIAALLFGIPVLGAERSKSAADPRVTSVVPFAIRSGTTSVVTVRGTALSGARAVLFRTNSLTARVSGVEHEAATEGAYADSVRADLVRLEITAAAGSEGPQTFRLVSAQGVSNELTLRVVDGEVVDETALHAPLNRFPVVVTGKIGARGEVDSIWIQAQAGETLTFTASSGTSSFDPSLTLAEPSGSWFDEGRLNRIAFNDEPLYFPGLSFDARLVHHFDKAGKYAIQIRAFSGQGGPDFSYQLRIDKGVGETPSLHPRLTGAWEERQFSRTITPGWLNLLAARGGIGPGTSPPATFHPVPGDAKEVPLMTAPGIAEGRITKPAETHAIRIRVDKPQDLAIEIETPLATMPRFNPVVRLLAPDGGEVVTNVYTKRNNNGLYMMKMIQAKSTFTLRSAGEYRMEIRDITSDVAGDDFAYRVLLRPQVPHVGRIEVPEDRINLEPGQSKAVTVNLEREEGFAGLVLLSADGLPPGVAATPGMANPIEKPPLPNGGRLERYVGKPQTATLILSAAEDAAPGDTPATVRVLVRIIVNNRQSPAIVAKEIPVMVIPRRPS